MIGEKEGGGEEVDHKPESFTKEGERLRRSFMRRGGEGFARRGAWSFMGGWTRDFTRRGV